jgi:hypothetical protein
MERWSSGNWSNGVLEYWNIGPETHHSTTPVFHQSNAGGTANMKDRFSVVGIQ